ncbi:hypothetical protein [Brunnivagina elsteri]|uniref:Uncharacterized protein n=1 Tax=Brunnivagina elsteri CCALA 953 TaxID=987040 RepID=A0A2A2TA42_9CYAN|nr:hypothetical protein [Calothrix elsteri]PAX45832.1 hypothetical protein CK510_29605 [Calothrix elsteri CCALA 953]
MILFSFIFCKIYAYKTISSRLGEDARVIFVVRYAFGVKLPCGNAKSERLSQSPVGWVKALRNPTHDMKKTEII